MSWSRSRFEGEHKLLLKRFDESHAKDKNKASVALAHPQLTKREVALAFTDTPVVFRAYIHYDDTIAHDATP